MAVPPVEVADKTLMKKAQRSQQLLRPHPDHGLLG